MSSNVLSFIKLSFLGDWISCCFVWDFSIFSLFFKSSCDFWISLLFFSETFRFRNSFFLCLHFTTKIVNYKFNPIINFNISLSIYIKFQLLINKKSFWLKQIKLCFLINYLYLFKICFFHMMKKDSDKLWLKIILKLITIN